VRGEGAEEGAPSGVSGACIVRCAGCVRRPVRQAGSARFDSGSGRVSSCVTRRCVECGVRSEELRPVYM
jgi:hypothetical protein